MRQVRRDLVLLAGVGCAEVCCGQICCGGLGWLRIREMWTGAFCCGGLGIARLDSASSDEAWWDMAGMVMCSWIESG